MARSLSDAAFWLVAAAAFAAACVYGLDMDALPRDAGWIAFAVAAGAGLVFGPRAIVAAIVVSLAFAVMYLVQYDPDDGDDTASLGLYIYFLVVPVAIGVVSGVGALIHMAVRWVVRLGD